MSLGVSPSSSSPLTTHARPLPPNRKRNSYTSSPRATPKLNQDDILPTTDELPTSTSGSIVPVERSPSRVKDQDGTMGGLRERSEDELKRAARNELEEALRKEWEGQERLMLQLEEADSNRRDLESKHDELVKALSSLQSRTDEACNEQSRMEADLEERDELLDRLRKRVAEAERQARDSQKRYIEQEETFNMERQALQAQEQHLQQRLKSMSQTKRSTTPSETENIACLKDELASINLSHSTLLAKLNTITKELHELKIVNEEIQEENEGWEFLIRERTLNGKVREGGILANKYEETEDENASEPPISTGPGRKTGLESLDEDLEAEMHELHSDLEAQSPIFDDDHDLFATNLDGSKQAGHSSHLAPPSRRRRGRKERTVSASSAVEGGAGGLDLAAELGMADDKSDGGASRDDVTKVDESAALRVEVKQLKESNKALSLYCSKIIDRIIAQEGFEHILSVDYKTRRAGASMRNGSSSARPALRDISSGAWGKDVVVSPVTEELPKIAEPEPVKEKKARPLSMMARALSGPAPTVAAPAPAPIEPENKDEKSEKRARRGFSLDFRSLGFGSSSTTTESKTALKPLTLSTRTSSSTSSTFVPPPPAPHLPVRSNSMARKLDIHAEDEEDRRERHRMEATLKLMGIERTTPPPSIREEREEQTEFSLHGKEWKGRNVPRYSSGRSSTSSASASASASGSGSGSTPLARLSSVIGEYEEPIPLDDVTDPEAAAAALRAFDQRQAKMREALTKGKAEKGYTSPPKIGVGLRHGTAERDKDRDRGRTVSKSESVKTLWSMGGDSRPGSGEVVVEKRA